MDGAIAQALQDHHVVLAVDDVEAGDDVQLGARLLLAADTGSVKLGFWSVLTGSCPAAAVCVLNLCSDFVICIVFVRN